MISNALNRFKITAIYWNFYTEKLKEAKFDLYFAEYFLVLTITYVNTQSYSGIMPTSWGRTKDVIEAKVRSTNTKDIEAVLMMAVDKAFFIIFRWRDINVGAIKASCHGRKSGHGSKLAR